MAAWIAGAAAFYVSQGIGGMIPSIGGVVPGLVVSIAVYLLLARRR